MSDLVDEYLLQNPRGPSGQRQLRLHSRLYEEFWSAGRLVGKGSELAVVERCFDRKYINRYLLGLTEEGKSSHYIRAQRASLTCLWRYAYEEGYTEERPRKLRPVKVDTRVQAFTRKELLRLYSKTACVSGKVPGRLVGLSTWWQAFIAVSYETALRRGDLLKLHHQDIDAKAGEIQVMENKTKKWARRKLSEHAMNDLALLAVGEDRGCPFERSTHDISYEFRLLTKLARVPLGTTQWIRRSAISYAEQAASGSGTLLGNHSSKSVTAKHYLDPAIARPEVVSPPPVNWGKE